MSQQRFVILAFVCGAILSGMVAQSASLAAIDYFAWTDPRLFGFVNSSVLFGAVVSIVAFFAALRNRDAVKFTDEVIVELSKVTWPTREETVRATTTVVLTTLFVASLLGLYDLLWKNVADLFLFTES